MTRRSPIERICENCIYRVTHRKKRKPEVKPSDIPSFDYSSHLADVRWLRMRSRRRKKMLTPNDIRHYETASIQRAGYCIKCGTKLTQLETHACDQCAIYLYADPNSEMREDEDDE